MAVVPGRRISLGFMRVLHGLAGRGAGIALRGFPQIYDIPVLGVNGPERDQLRQRLEAALELLERVEPSRLDRLRRSVSGLFVTSSRRLHGHYGRITGTCTLDRGLLLSLPPEDIAEHLVYCATEAALWRAGLGRSADEEERLHRAAEQAARLFMDRLAHARGGEAVA